MTTQIQTQASDLLDLARAKALAATLFRRGRDGSKLSAYVREYDRRIYFRGGVDGEHSLSLDVSSEARVRAHWAGYCESNGLPLVPAVGELVVFESGSAVGGSRIGKVVKVGRSRATVAYSFHNGKKAADKSVAIDELVFGALRKAP